MKNAILLTSIALSCLSVDSAHANGLPSYVLGARLIDRSEQTALELHCTSLNEDPETRERIPCVEHRFVRYYYDVNQQNGIYWGEPFSLDAKSLERGSRQSYRSALSRAMKAFFGNDRTPEEQEILSRVNIMMGGMAGVSALTWIYMEPDVGKMMTFLTGSLSLIMSESFVKALRAGVTMPRKDELSNFRRENFQLRTKTISDRRMKKTLELIQ